MTALLKSLIHTILDGSYLSFSFCFRDCNWRSILLVILLCLVLSMHTIKEIPWPKEFDVLTIVFKEDCPLFVISFSWMEWLLCSTEVDVILLTSIQSGVYLDGKIISLNVNISGSSSLSNVRNAKLVKFGRQSLTKTIRAF